VATLRRRYTAPAITFISFINLVLPPNTFVTTFHRVLFIHLPQPSLGMFNDKQRMTLDDNDVGDGLPRLFHVVFCVYNGDDATDGHFVLTRSGPYTAERHRRVLGVCVVGDDVEGICNVT